MKEELKIEEIVIVKIPKLHSSADCGSSSFDDGYDLIDIEIPESEAHKMSKDKFVVWASGDSMLPEIEPGDMIIIDVAKNPNHRDIVIASHCGDLLIKRLIVSNFSMFLRSDNPKYDDIKVDTDNTKIIGQVVWVCKKKC